MATKKLKRLKKKVRMTEVQKGREKIQGFEEKEVIEIALEKHA